MDGERGAERLRVLFYTSQFPNPQDPAAAVFHHQLVLELQKLCDVTVVCPMPWFPRWSWLKRFSAWYAYSQIPDQFDFDGVQVYCPKYPMLPRVSGSIQSFLVLLGSVAAVLKLHRQKRFELVNSLWLFPDSVAARWIARLLGVPLVPTAMGCDVNKMLNEGGKRWQILGMLRGAPNVLAKSEELRQRMIEEGIPAARITTIPNGVNRSTFQLRERAGVRKELGMPLDKRIIVYVGRLSEEKGIPTLIAATGRLRQKRSDFLLCLVGDGPLRQSLQEQVQASGAADAVHFAGRQDPAAVAKWYGACNVFCLPSLREGTPNVVLEALSSGRPVVASNVGGIPALLSDYSGTLVEPQNVEALATALDQALDRNWDEQRIFQSMEAFTWQGAAEKYHGAYVKSLARAHPGGTARPAVPG